MSGSSFAEANDRFSSTTTPVILSEVRRVAANGVEEPRATTPPTPLRTFLAIQTATPFEKLNQRQLDTKVSQRLRGLFWQAAIRDHMMHRIRLDDLG